MSSSNRQASDYVAQANGSGHKVGESGTEQSASARNTFVGRERELAELISACESGADSDAHLFLIHGEPGIGKTRLADELASRVKARGPAGSMGPLLGGGRRSRVLAVDSGDSQLPGRTRSAASQ